MTVQVGDRVFYVMSQEAADQVNQRRKDGFTGNDAAPGQKYPMTVTLVLGLTVVNGQVMLDGNTTAWAPSVEQGEGSNNWSLLAP